jgi:aspartate dehydrogenase
MDVGIVGCGAIGREIALNLPKIKGMRLTHLSDIDKEKAELLSLFFSPAPKVVELSELVENVDLVVESASADAVSGVVKRAISAHSDVMIMSVGGIVQNRELLAKAERSGIKVYIPSGAICGIDGIKAASCGKIKSVKLTTRKPPSALKDAEYVKRKRMKLSQIKREKVVFSGSAVDAVNLFPANINVAATLSLAGIGLHKTEVVIVADPKIKRNIHQIEIEGESGRISVTCENLPSKNPKTSQLAYLSAIALLRQIASSVRIGT